MDNLSNNINNQIKEAGNIQIDNGANKNIPFLYKILIGLTLLGGLVLVFKRYFPTSQILSKPIQISPIPIDKKITSKIDSNRVHLIEIKEKGISFNLIDWGNVYHKPSNGYDIILFQDEKQKQAYLDCISSLSSDNCTSFAFAIKISNFDIENKTLGQIAIEKTKLEFDTEDYQKPYGEPTKFQFVNKLGQLTGYIFYRNGYTKKDYSEQISVAFLEYNNMVYYIKIIYPRVEHEQLDQVLKSLRFDNEPSPSPRVKFTGKSIIGKCNNTYPLCPDESYLCFIVEDRPCGPLITRKCDARNIGDGLCHRKCESDYDCSDGFYCGSIEGYSGDVIYTYDICFQQ